MSTPSVKTAFFVAASGNIDYVYADRQSEIAKRVRILSAPLLAQEVTESPDALTRLMTERADLTALLDVTHPEQPGTDYRLSHMPNVLITSHIAGAINNEVLRMADLCIDEFDRFVSGRPLSHEVTLEQLSQLA
jgi:hypothetical protein